jgi:hypothetical protein
MHNVVLNSITASEIASFFLCAVRKSFDECSKDWRDVDYLSLSHLAVDVVLLESFCAVEDISRGSACSFLLCSLIDPEEGGCMFFENVSERLPTCKVFWYSFVRSYHSENLRSNIRSISMSRLRIYVKSTNSRYLLC